jgi:hypothetical protein
VNFGLAVNLTLTPDPSPEGRGETSDIFI